MPPQQVYPCPRPGLVWALGGWRRWVLCRPHPVGGATEALWSGIGRVGAEPRLAAFWPRWLRGAPRPSPGLSLRICETGAAGIISVCPGPEHGTPGLARRGCCVGAVVRAGVPWPCLCPLLRPRASQGGCERHKPPVQARLLLWKGGAGGGSGSGWGPDPQAHAVQPRQGGQPPCCRDWVGDRSPSLGETGPLTRGRRALAAALPKPLLQRSGFLSTRSPPPSPGLGAAGRLSPAQESAPRPLQAPVQDPERV